MKRQESTSPLYFRHTAMSLEMWIRIIIHQTKNRHYFFGFAASAAFFSSAFLCFSRIISAFLGHSKCCLTRWMPYFSASLRPELFPLLASASFFCALARSLSL